MYYPLLALFICCICHDGSCRSLAFAQESVGLKSSFGQKLISAEYPFVNVGKSPVTIIRVVTPCGCLSSKLEKSRYEPGESGTLKVTIDLANRFQEITYAFDVFTNERATEADNKYVLNIAVIVPTPITVGPRVLLWKIGESLRSRTVEIAIDKQVDARLLRVTSIGLDSDKFIVKMRKSLLPNLFTLEITPMSTATAAQAMLQPEFEGIKNLPYDVKVLLAIR